MLLLTVISAQQTNEHSHDEHAAMMHRGEHAMGFSQEKTTHHFLTREGGVIAVSANGAADGEGRDQIRMHLSHIAKMFASGDFDIPMFIHNTNPPVRRSWPNCVAKSVTAIARPGTGVRSRFTRRMLRHWRLFISSSDSKSLSTRRETPWTSQILPTRSEPCLKLRRW
jgi:hypothetical protein